MASLLSSPSLTLKLVKHELKEWEHTFRRLHGRSPSKDDIKASPSIYALYKDYGRLKLREQAGKSSLWEKHGTASCEKIIPCPKRFKRSCSPSRSAASSDTSEGSHISATPPRKKPFAHGGKRCTDSISSGGVVTARQSVRSTSLKELNMSRPVLSSITCNSGAPKCSQGFESSAQGLHCGLDSQNRSLSEKSASREISCGEGESGFTIKLQRFGEHEKENLDATGTFLSSISSCIKRTKPLSRRVFATSAVANKLNIRNMESAEVKLEDKSPSNPPLHENNSSFIPNNLTNPQDLSVAASTDISILKQTTGMIPPAACKSANLIGLSGARLAVLNTDGMEDDKAAVKLAMPNFSKFTVMRLRKFLQDRGLPPSGNKPALVARLQKAFTEGYDFSNVTFDPSLQKNEIGLFSRDATAENLHGNLCQKSSRPSSDLNKEVASQRLPENRYRVTPVARDNPSSEKTPKSCATALSKQRCECEVKKVDNSGTGINDILLPSEPRAGAACVVHAAAKEHETTKRSISTRHTHNEGFLSWHSVINVKNLTKKSSSRENFVKLNIRKVRYGSRSFSNHSYKRKAGGSGHRFKFYSKRKKKGLLAITDGEVDQNNRYESVMDINQNTLNEAAHNDAAVNSPGQNSLLHPTSTDTSQTAENGRQASLSVTSAAADALANPIEANLLRVLQMVFGYSSFRPGQLETIQRTLVGDSTMLVLPTGSGKSLCYQLPAFLLPGLTLVISPLVALMLDQLRHLPAHLPGAVLSSIQTSKEYSSIVDRLRSGKLKVLFISPERFLCGDFISLLESLPLVSLAVVDEAHCLSEWSHNFRPSYFGLGVILREKLKLSCVLAMTATATKSTLDSVMHSLRIPPSGLLQISSVRANLTYTVLCSDNRCKDLLSLLQSASLSEVQNTIVYCNFQHEADNVSLILQDNGIKAKSYHGGMSLQDRKHIQELFCSNKLRVIVATVAFGLGLDKSDIHAVIHYGLPNSLEHYVQETGRAGRDGNLAHCWMLLDNSNYLKLRSLAYSDNVEEYAITKLLCKIFKPSSISDIRSPISSLPVESTMKELDLKEEVIATTLSYLQIGDVQYLSVLPQLKTTCTLRFHKNSAVVLANKNFLVDAIVKRSNEKHGEFTFELPSVANFTGFKLPDVQQQLEQLQVAGEISFSLKSPAFCFEVLKVPDDLNFLASKIAERFAVMEDQKVKKLDFMFETATTLSKKEEVTASQSCLSETLRLYFESAADCMPSNPPSIVQSSSAFLKADIKVFLQMNAGGNLTSRAVARIFHGISSPAYPASAWLKNHFWGRYKHVDFKAIKSSVANELQTFSAP